MPASNERFHESGGICSQEQLCKFASASLARTRQSSGIEHRTDNGVQADKVTELRSTPKAKYSPTM